MKKKAWPDKCYPDSALGKLTLIDWFYKFKRGRANIDDAQRSGRPKRGGYTGKRKKWPKNRFRRP